MKVKKLLIKIALVFGLISLLIGQTYAFYSDIETSTSNLFAAGSLDFKLTTVDDNPIVGYLINAEDLIPGYASSGSFKIVNLGTLGFEYSITAEKTSGSTALFNELDIDVTVEGSLVYSGKLSSISLSPLPIYSDPDDLIVITVTLPFGASSSLQLLECVFDIVVKGDQVGSMVGFWDEERFSNRITTSDWTPPVISHMMLASPGVSNEVVVTWNTDELATSNVEIGATNSYGTSFPIVGDSIADSTSHSVTLSGLSLYTTYHMRVVSTDGFGNPAYSDDYEFRIELAGIDLLPRWGIVINEILPNPIGLDDSLRPGGEWVELYNKGGSVIDVSGWRLCSLGQCITINSLNTMSGGTVVSPSGFLVVYFENSFPGGILNNSGFDVITLRNNGGELRDMHWYYGSQEGKSIVRYPDGANIWFDPMPTPGMPNTLESHEIISEEEIVDEE